MRARQDFLEAGRAKMSWLDKVLDRAPRLRNTGQMGPAIRQQKTVRVLGPSWVDKVVTCVLLLFVSIFYMPCIGLLQDGFKPVLAPLAALLFLSWIVCLLLWHRFINPRYHFRIRIDGASITVGKESYTWSEIAETAILQKMQGRYDNAHLVLFLRDGTVRSFDLYKYRITATGLAGIIEFYKASGTVGHRTDKR